MWLVHFFHVCAFILAPLLKRPRTPPTGNPSMDYQTADSDHVLKRTRPFGISDEVLIKTHNFLAVIWLTIVTLETIF